MKHRIADAHVHLEDVEEGKFFRPEKMLDTISSKGVTDLSLLAYMPFSDVVSNLRVLYWKKNCKKLNVRAFGSFHECDIYKDVPYEKQYEKLLVEAGEKMLFDIKGDEKSAVCARWIEEMLLE